MAAADVLAQFMPDLAKAKGYMPDSGLQAQIMQNGTDAQADRLRQMANIREKAGRAPAEALMQALQSGKEFYKMGGDRQELNARLAEEQAKTEGANIQNKRSSLSLGSEEQYQKWLDQPTGPEEGAASRRDKMNQTGYDKDLLSNDAERQRQGIEQQSAGLRQKQVMSDLATQGFNLGSAKEQLEAQHFGQAVDSIIYNPGMNDQQKQAELQKITDHGQHQGGMEPRAYNALTSTAWTHYQAQKSSAATAAQGKEQATELSKPYQDLTNATKSTLGGVGQVSALHKQLQNYQNSLNFGPVHSDTAQAATAGFVGTLRQMAKQGDEQAGKLADYVESSNPLNGQAGDKMQKVLGIMSQRVQDRWHTEYEPQVTPELRGRPEYQQTLQAVQGLSNLTGSGKNQKNSGNLFGSGGKATVDNKGFTNPGAQGGATAAPSQPPPQQGAGFSPMPVPGGTIQLPGQGTPPPGMPPQQPPAFNPALRQPMDNP